MFTLEELFSKRNQNQAFEYLGTKYKGFYLSGWLGEYELIGEPKYMDLLY